MIKPIFKHPYPTHEFMGQIAHAGKLYDIYTAKGGEHGEEIHARSDNKPHNPHMPLEHINGGGMRNTVLEAARSLVDTKRLYHVSGEKYSSLNEMI